MAEPIDQGISNPTSGNLAQLAAHPDLLALLQWAAVLGPALTETALAQVGVFPPPTVAELLARAVAQGLLESDPQGREGYYAFAREPLREALYAALPPEERAARHRRALELLPEGEETAGARAWHYEQLGDAEQALPYARLAANRDRATYANTTAIHYYTQALRLLHAHPELADVRLEYELRDGRATCYRLSGERAEELADLAAMARIAEKLEEVARQIEVATRQVTVATELGNHGEALRNAEIALALSRQISDRKLEADSYTALGDVGFRMGEQDRPREAHLRALELYRELKDRAGEANSLRMLGRVAYRGGKYDEVRAYSERALTLYRELRDRVGEATMLNALGVISSDRAKARDYYEQSLGIVEAIGDRAGQARGYNNLALIYWSLGLYPRARDYLEQAVQIERDLQGRANLAYYLESLGRVYLELQVYEPARQVLEEGRDLAVELGDRWSQSVYWLGLGRVALAEEQLGQALELFQTAAKMLREIGALGDLATCLSWLGMTYLMLGDWEAAYRNSAEAVAHLKLSGNAGDYGPQDVWWNHYRILAADPARAEASEINDEMWTYLQRAREDMLSAIATLSDEGLRRNYLNKVKTNNAILTEWTRQSARRAPELLRGESSPDLPVEQDAVAEAQQLRDRFKRVLDVSRQMNELHDAESLFGFVMDQVIEMSGAERGFLALLGASGALNFRITRGMTSGEVARAKKPQGYAALNEVAQSRLPVLLQDVSDEGAPPAPEADLSRRSVLCVPLLSHAGLLGMIYADIRSVSGRFSQADLDLLTIFANQAGTAIENARLYQETAAWAHTLEQRVGQRTSELQEAYETLSRRARQLETSNQVGQQLTALLDLDELLEQVVGLIQSQFEYYFVGAWLIEEQAQMAVLRAGAGAAATEAGYALGYAIPLTADHPLATVARTGEAYMTAGSCALPSGPMPAHLICNEALFPLCFGERVLGILDIQSDREEVFDEDEQLVLETLANQISITIRNAQLYHSEQRRRRMAESLEQAGREMSQSLLLTEVPGLILEQLARVVPYERCSIMLKRGEGVLQIVAQRGFPKGERPEELRIRIREDDVFLEMGRTREPVLIDDVTQVPGWQIVEWLPLNKSWLGVPLISKGEVIGMISMTRAAAAAFGEDEAQLVPAFAAQAVIALENARLYEELNQAYQTLERLNRTKSSFIEVTAHELRTPLSVIKGYTQLLGNLPSVKEDPQAEPALKGILSGADRLHEIVNSILDVTKIDSELLQIRRHPVQLEDIIKRIATTFKSDLRERNLTISLEGLETLPVLQADLDLLYKVFHHLLINAIKYTPDGGAITVSGHVDETDHTVEVVISDTGIGIDPEHHALIFEKFYQTGEVAFHSSGRTKFKGGGPGLGLAIAKGIVEAHGGTIWVHSDGYDEGRCPGSHFHVKLPLT